MEELVVVVVVVVFQEGSVEELVVVVVAFQEDRVVAVVAVVGRLGLEEGSELLTNGVERLSTAPEYRLDRGDAETGAGAIGFNHVLPATRDHITGG